MKDAAAKIAGEGWYNTAEAHKELARRIRSAIRRAVKAERERCVECVKTARNSTKIGEFVCDNIIDAIQAKAKRPSRKRK
jgi:hypothetical protein